MTRIDGLTSVSVRGGRLLPDYVLGRRPRFFAKAVIRDPAGREETRYFNLGRGHS